MSYGALMLSTYDDNEAAIMQKARDKRKFLNVAEKNGAVRINIESRLARYAKVSPRAASHC
jgi:hypothetical protein